MKRFMAVVCVVCAAAGSVAAQSQMADLRAYFRAVSQQPDFNSSFPEETYYGEIPAENERFSVLGGNSQFIDSFLEFALLTYYQTDRAGAQKGNAVLPVNSPKQAGLKLGAAVFQEMQVLRFLNDTAALGRYENVLKYVCDKSGASRAEVEKYFADGIKNYIFSSGIKNVEPNEDTIRVFNIVIKEPLGDFFIAPNQANFNKLKRNYNVFSKSNFMAVIKVWKEAKDHVKFLAEIGSNDRTSGYLDMIKTAEPHVTAGLKELGVTYTDGIQWTIVHLSFESVLDFFLPALKKRLEQ